jgi:hypothetical protein
MEPPDLLWKVYYAPVAKRKELIIIMKELTLAI